VSRAHIADLVHRYADAVVRRDEAQWAATWAATATWELAPGWRVEGRDEIVDLWNRAMDGFAAVVQTVSNGTAELDEEAGTGTGRWYVSEHWKRTDGTGGILLAYYDDEYVRTDGEWSFAARALTAQYNGPADLSGDFLNAWG
jgi:hypothetical protein